MANPQYLPRDRNGRLFRVIEECGEVLHALGKAGRFGMEHEYKVKTVIKNNAQYIYDELQDLKSAITDLESDLKAFIGESK